MLVQYIEYDAATGVYSNKYELAPYAMAGHTPPAGRVIMEVPQEVLGATLGQLNLPPLREVMLAKVDREAEEVRGRFLTAGDGQMATYQRKEAEARAYALDAAAVVPFLRMEAAASDMELGELVTEVLAAANAWVVLGGRIEAARMSAKRFLTAATTQEEILKLGTVDWEAVIAPPAEQPALPAPEPEPDPAPEQPEDAE